MSRQMTLFGSLPKKPPDVIYRSPLGNYECFIEAFYFNNWQKGTKQDVHLQAQEEWKRKYAEGKDPEGLKKYLDNAKDSLKRTVTEPATVQRKGFFVKTSVSKSVSSSSNAEAEKTSSSSTSQKRKAQETSLDYSFPNKVTAIESREEYLSTKELMEVYKLLNDLCPSINTDDVKKNESFMKPLATVAFKINEYRSLSVLIKANRERSRKTKMSGIMSEIEKKAKNTVISLENAAAIQISSKISIDRIASSSLEKMKLLTKALTDILALAMEIERSNINAKMKKRVIQVNGKAEYPFKRGKNELRKFICYNSSTHEFRDSFTVIENCTVGKIGKYGLELNRLGQYIERSLFASTEELSGHINMSLEDFESAVLHSLLQIFPLIFMETPGGKGLVFNTQELLLSRGAFIDLFDITSDGEDITLEAIESSKQQFEGNASADLQPTESSKKGRPAIHIQFPGVVNAVTEFLKQNSYAAEGKRRSSTATGSGVTLAQIRTHLFKTIPGLEEHGISRTTIHQLFVPPRKNTIAAKSYKSLVDAKVPCKRNTYRIENIDQHFLFSRIAMRDQLMALFHRHAVEYSCDDMNKLLVGVNAVSRYHQIRHFFMSDDCPDYSDHDFPYPGYKILVSGYMALEVKENSNGIDDEFCEISSNDRYEEQLAVVEMNKQPLSEDSSMKSESKPSVVSNENPECEMEEDKTERSFEILDKESTEIDQVPTMGPKATELLAKTKFDGKLCYDKLGRLQISRPTTGSSVLRLRAQLFHSSSAQSHANDLLPILQRQVAAGKTVAAMKVDNGPDWSLSSLSNLLYFMRMWRDSELDVLLLMSNAARFSAYNNIEHLWSPVSNKLTGLVLPAVLEGDEKAPCHLKISTEERRQKEAKLFDKNMDLLTTKYLADMTYDTFCVNPIPVYCNDVPSPYNDHDSVYKIMRGPLREIRGTNNGSLMAEFRFLLKHVDKKANEVCFAKCQEPTCTHCCNSPIVAKDFWTVMQENNYRLPNPARSASHPDHYQTFFDSLDLPKEARPTGNNGLPSIKSNLGVCPACPAYVFSSKTEEKRHMSVFHHDKKGVKRKTGSHICTFQKDQASICGLEFTSRKNLLMHKHQRKHALRRKVSTHPKSVSNTVPLKRKGVMPSIREYMVSSRRVEEQDDESYDNNVNNAEDNDDDDDDGDDNDDDAVCIICNAEDSGGDGAEDEWVLCSQCNSWCHEYCIRCIWKIKIPPNVMADDDAVWLCKLCRS